MRILILNWRDIKNPSSGGAEILTHEIAKRLVKWGNLVTQFSAFFPGGKHKEIIDGVEIIREGNPDARYFLTSVHLKAYQYYTAHQEKFDVVIDEIHGLPFFTPWYVKGKKIALICEIAGHIWYKTFGPIFGIIGEITEKVYLRFVYSSMPFLTISPSTKLDLQKHGISSSHINVLPMGISRPKTIIRFSKEKELTIIFVGRLTPAKGIENAIIALFFVIQKYPRAKLWVVGRGEQPYEKHLRSLAKKNNIEQNIIFNGFLTEEEKYNRMARAHILVHPSIKEGFGLTVAEAGFVGTPSVAYNVTGIRDIIKSNISGILTKKNTPKSLAQEIINLYSQKVKYEKFCTNAKNASNIYSWDKTAQMTLDVLKTL